MRRTHTISKWQPDLLKHYLRAKKRCENKYPHMAPGVVKSWVATYMRLLATMPTEFETDGAHSPLVKEDRYLIPRSKEQYKKDMEDYHALRRAGSGQGGIARPG